MEIVGSMEEVVVRAVNPLILGKKLSPVRGRQEDRLEGVVRVDEDWPRLIVEGLKRLAALRDASLSRPPRFPVE